MVSPVSPRASTPINPGQSQSARPAPTLPDLLWEASGIRSLIKAYTQEGKTPKGLRLEEEASLRSSRAAQWMKKFASYRATPVEHFGITALQLPSMEKLKEIASYLHVVSAESGLAVSPQTLASARDPRAFVVVHPDDRLLVRIGRGESDEFRPVSVVALSLLSHLDFNGSARFQITKRRSGEGFQMQVRANIPVSEYAFAHADVSAYVQAEIPAALLEGFPVPQREHVGDAIHAATIVDGRFEDALERRPELASLEAKAKEGPLSGDDQARLDKLKGRDQNADKVYRALIRAGVELADVGPYHDPYHQLVYQSVLEPLALPPPPPADAFVEEGEKPAAKSELPKQLFRRLPAHPGPVPHFKPALENLDRGFIDAGRARYAQLFQHLQDGRRSSRRL